KKSFESQQRLEAMLRELSPNLGDGRGSGGSGLSLRSDDLDSVGELYTEDNFRQLVVAIEATPAFLGGFGKLEDHGERGLVGETSLGAHGAVAHGCKRTFDDVGRAQMLPVFGGEVVEGEQRVAILDQALDCLVVFDAPGCMSSEHPGQLAWQFKRVSGPSGS